MKTCYVLEGTRAIADLIAPGELMPYWTISRINVPKGQRGEGLGSELLNRILQDADTERTTLCLEPRTYGEEEGLTQDQLTAWYGRKGFKLQRSTGYMIRRPQ